LAEDNEINRLVAIEVLSIAGFACDVAENGQEAIDRLLEVPYDVILMDCQMPGLDGLEATREIRRLATEGALRPRGYRVPIVALTANAIEGDRRRCLAAGMDHYLPKPLDALQLVELHDALLNTLYLDSATSLPANATIKPSIAHSVGPSAAAATRVGSASSDRQPAFDLEELAHRCLGNQELVDRIFRKFVERLPAAIRELEAAVSSGHTEVATTKAHTLRGSAANLSAHALRRSLGDLEAACGTLDMERVGVCISVLRRESRACLEYAEQLERTPQAAR
jgi:Amt family ammonium transporter